MISPPVSIVALCFTYVKQMFHHGAKLLLSLCFTTVTHVYLWIACVTWRWTCDNPFVSLGLQLFSYGSCVLPVWHTYSSVFTWKTEVISAGFLLDSMWLFWRNFLWVSCGSCRDSCVILAKILCVSCENLVYARGLLWGNTARQRPQEIAFGIPELTAGDPAILCAATVPQHYFW